jgi:hypothetical protein
VVLGAAILCLAAVLTWRRRHVQPPPLTGDR